LRGHHGGKNHEEGTNEEYSLAEPLNVFHHQPPGKSPLEFRTAWVQSVFR
jgi:hypothetical protein